MWRNKKKIFIHGTPFRLANVDSNIAEYSISEMKKDRPDMKRIPSMTIKEKND